MIQNSKYSFHNIHYRIFMLTSKYYNHIIYIYIITHINFPTQDLKY